MFDPERLLGQLMGDAMSGRLGGRRHPRKASGLGGLLGGSMSTGTKAKLGLGLLGIAVAAYQHYQGQGATPPSPLSGAGTPPPPPGATATPPPPPMPVSTAIPAPGPARGEQAMLLVRAMVTAADADGLIDADEREAILGRARDAGLDAETLQALDAEIRAPLTVQQLVVRTPVALRDEVYAAALIAIHADTEAERAFLDDLATRLELDPARRAGLHAQLGLPAGG